LVENCWFAGSASGEKYELRDDRVHDENVHSKQQRRNYINSKLGSGTQPVLETVKYQASIVAIPAANSDIVLDCNNRFILKSDSSPYFWIQTGWS